MLRLITATLGLLLIGLFSNCKKNEKIADDVDHLAIQEKEIYYFDSAIPSEK